MRREQILALSLGVLATAMLVLLAILAVLPEDTSPSTPAEAKRISSGLQEDDASLTSQSPTPLWIALGGLGFAGAAGFAGLFLGARQRKSLERGE